MSHFLRIANIKKAYKIDEYNVQKVLNGVTINFEKGELVSLLGESGSGKSTLLNIIGGLDNDFSGSVVYKGKFMSDYSEKELDIYHKRSIGFVFQNYNLIPHMTILQNIEIAMVANGVPEKKRRRRALELLKMVGLSYEKRKLPNQLSGGQKQRVAIARALANNPSIILADEPTGALDKESAEVIFNILKSIADAGKLVIIVTHSQSISDKCNRVIKIEEGLVVDDNKEEISDIPKVKYEPEENRYLSNKDNFMIALGNIIRNKARNITIAIGIAISIISMILILNLSDGLSDYVISQYSDDPKASQLIVTSNNFNDISDNISDIESIEGVLSVRKNEVFTTNNKASSESASNVSVDTVTTFISDKYAPEVIFGTTVTQTGQTIISEALAIELFDNNIITAIGQNLTITYGSSSYKTLTLQIVGVYNVFNDNGIYALESDLDVLYEGQNKINMAYVTVYDIKYITNIIEDIEDMGLIVTQEDSEAQTIIDYINIGGNVLVGVSAASMVVGAIMIYIVLYICVVERTKEIGVFRAIGFEKKDIRKMFTFEAFLLGLGSGLLGCIICLVLTILVNTVTMLTMDVNIIAYNILYYLLGLFISCFVSVLSGLSPAISASQLDPITSLRYE